MNLIKRLSNLLTSPPFWPYGFVGTNILFAALAIFSIVILAYDQHAATYSMKVQEKNFATYRENFDRATNVKIGMLEIIARKIGVTEEEMKLVDLSQNQRWQHFKDKPTLSDKIESTEKRVDKIEELQPTSILKRVFKKVK